MSESIVTQELAGCICMGARRATRQLTQIFDNALAPAGLTANQFGVLSHLYGSALEGRERVPLGVLAQRMGKHASTLNRDLKLLETAKLVVIAHDPADGRVRVARLTAKGQSQLKNALPRWRKAQEEVRQKLGADTLAELRRALNAANRALESVD